MLYLHLENRGLQAESEQLSVMLAALRADNDQLKEQVADVRSSLDDVRVASESAVAICDTEFPSGLCRLLIRTNYGPDTPREYEIYHASVPLAEWRIDVGTRLNSFGLPTDFYFDYDGDGRIDTAR